MQHENILEALYYGHISPWEKKFDRDSEYAKNMEIIAANEEKLSALLSGTREGQLLLAELIDAQSNVQSFSELGHFIEGFRLGAEFILDTFVLPRKSVVSDIT